MKSKLNKELHKIVLEIKNNNFYMDKDIIGGFLNINAVFVDYVVKFKGKWYSVQLYNNDDLDIDESISYKFKLLSFLKKNFRKEYYEINLEKLVN